MSGVLAVTPTSGPAWWSKYNLATGNPDSVLDFVNNRYRSGGAITSLGSLMTGTLNVSSSGLLLNQTNIAATGALLTAMKSSSCTVLAEVSGSANDAYGGIVTSNGADTLLFKVNTNKLRSYVSASGLSLDTDNTADWTLINYCGNAFDGSSTGVCLNSGRVAYSTAGGNLLAPVTSIQFGIKAGSYPFGGYLRRLIVFPRKLNNWELRRICVAAPYTLLSQQIFSGAHSLAIGSGQQVSCGNVLAYERTQPWTMMAAIKTSVAPAEDALIAGNSTASPFTGYEIFIRPDGTLASRVLSSFTGNNYLGVFGYTNLCDGHWHVVGATYDGSSTAAGLKLYVDGYVEPLAVERDTLTASIISASPMLVGNQVGYLNSFFLNGSVDEFSISNVVRSASYMAAHAKSGSMPAISDGNVQLHYDFEAGVGTSVTDDSGNGYNGTITSSAMWL